MSPEPMPLIKEVIANMETSKGCCGNSLLLISIFPQLRRFRKKAVWLDAIIPVAKIEVNIAICIEAIPARSAPASRAAFLTDFVDIPGIKNEKEEDFNFSSLA